MNNCIIRSLIRVIPDFPIKGINFQDITPILTNPETIPFICSEWIKNSRADSLDGLIAIESRGFLFGVELARQTGLPLFLARKQGKLPNADLSRQVNNEYGISSLELRSSDFANTRRLAVIDDVIATGNTIKLVCEMLRELEIHVPFVYALIAIPSLFGKSLDNHKIVSNFSLFENKLISCLDN